MSDSTCPRRRIAGYNQFVKILRRGKAKKVYLASDADVFFADGVRRELKAHPEVSLDTTKSLSELAQMAGVDVPTAVITEIEQ